MTTRTASRATSRPSDALSLEQKVELYYWMRLTRSLEERLVNLYRQTKVVGGLFRSFGQEADAVGSAFALDRSAGDILSPLIRNLGSMLVQGAQPLEIIRQYIEQQQTPHPPPPRTAAPPALSFPGLKAEACRAPGSKGRLTR